VELEGTGWENVDWVRVAENSILLGLVDKTVMKLLSNVRQGM
jgi:hypothetical protein